MIRSTVPYRETVLISEVKKPNDTFLVVLYTEVIFILEGLYIEDATIAQDQVGIVISPLQLLISQMDSVQ